MHKHFGQQEGSITNEISPRTICKILFQAFHHMVLPLTLTDDIMAMHYVTNAQCKSFFRSEP